MQKMVIAILTICTMLSLAMHVRSAEQKNIQAQWSEITTKQIAEHLGLNGGNITFNFDEPCYINIKAVGKSGPEEPLEVIMDAWSDQPSTTHGIFISALDLSKDDHIHRRVKITHSEPNGWSSYRFNANFESEMGKAITKTAYGSNWTQVNFDQPAILYEVANTNDPSAAYYRYTVTFSNSKPNASIDQ